MPFLKDKTVLIMGRGSGIARAIALAVTDNDGQIMPSPPEPSIPAPTTPSGRNGRPRCSRPGPPLIPSGVSVRRRHRGRGADGPDQRVPHRSLHPG
jgi:hypothetical protein